MRNGAECTNRLSLRHAEQAGARRILQLDPVIEEPSSIVDDSVQFY